MPVETQTAPAPKATKTSHYLSMTSTAIGIIGALGTFGVWACANFYTGTVQVKAQDAEAVQKASPNQALVIKAYSTKGSEAVFHSPTFQLMPGHYHLEIKHEGTKVKHAEVDVEFQKTSPVAITFTEDDLRTTSKHHWWQVWKKSDENATQ
jgi:hypothetical protein